MISRQRPTVEGPPVEVPEPSADLAGNEGLIALMRGLAAPPHAPGTGAPPPPLPPSLAQFAELQAIINAAWQQREGKRPTARAVHRALASLMTKYLQ